MVLFLTRVALTQMILTGQAKALFVHLIAATLHCTSVVQKSQNENIATNEAFLSEQVTATYALTGASRSNEYVGILVTKNAPNKFLRNLRPLLVVVRNRFFIWVKINPTVGLSKWLFMCHLPMI
jgi:phage-related protein